MEVHSVTPNLTTVDRNRGYPVTDITGARHWKSHATPTGLPVAPRPSKYGDGSLEGYRRPYRQFSSICYIRFVVVCELRIVLSTL